MNRELHWKSGKTADHQPESRQKQDEPAREALGLHPVTNNRAGLEQEVQFPVHEG